MGDYDQGDPTRKRMILCIAIMLIIGILGILLYFSGVKLHF